MFFVLQQKIGFNVEEEGSRAYCENKPFLCINWGWEFSSYKTELRNRVTQNDVILRVTNSKMFLEILFSSY